MERYNEQVARAQAWALRTLLFWSTVLLCTVLAITLAGLLGGCESPPEVATVEAEGSARVYIETTDGDSVEVLVGVELDYETATGDTYTCPTLRLCGVLEDNEACGQGLMPGFETLVDARCLEDPGPFVFTFKSAPPLSHAASPTAPPCLSESRAESLTQSMAAVESAGTTTVQPVPMFGWLL